MARVLRRGPGKQVSPEQQLFEPGAPYTLAEAASAAAATMPVPKPRHHRRWLRIAAIALAGVVGFSAGTAYGYDRVNTTRFFPGTRVGGVLVGSRNAQEAEALLRERFVTPLHQPITLRAPEFEKTATPWKLGFRLDVASVVGDELTSQQETPLAQRLWRRVTGGTPNVALRPKLDPRALESFLGETIDDINRSAVDARLEVVNGKLTVHPHSLGRKLDVDAATDSVIAALRARKASAELPVRVTQPARTTDAFRKVIWISTGGNTLRLYVDGKAAKSYAVATGTGGYPTPLGQFSITAKRHNPTWVNPYSDWSLDMPASIGPGPNNPLGTRALNLSASGIRIHGTPNAGSIGTNASHGCIRMHMRDSEELFDLVGMGTPVLITG